MSAGVDLYKVNVDELAVVFESPEIQRLLGKVTERNNGTHTVEDYMAALATARMQLWILAKPGDILGIAMTEILSHPQRKVGSVIAAVGREREKWQHHLSGIESWARQIGCDSIKLVARPGWKRVFTDYRHSHSLLEKDL